ncbi:MAG TPA: ABC transporter substrate-binding protein [Candidatus Alistipes intestinipullorum]|nr:ABC transporter substrate-binding protein [Candidatus Alistipes intestinipullorum]
MKRTFRILPILLAALLYGCAGSSTALPEDFTAKIYTPDYASGFDIRGNDNDASTLITIRNPWQGGADVEQYLLVLRGDARQPKAFPGQVVHAPVRRVVCMSTSHVALLDAIGQAKRICGVSGIDYISNAHVREHRLCGEVRDVGYDSNLNFELLSAMRPDLMLLYGVTGENTVITRKLEELGIPYIYIGDYMEESPLGKAEWMVVTAEICDLRVAGTDTLHRIAADYNRLKKHIAEQMSETRPRVMLNTPYRDTWFMPSTRSYMVRLIEDAGGRYIYPQNDSNTSVAVDMEEAYLLASEADCWINVGACNTLKELTAQNPKFASVPAVRNRRVWNNNRRQTPAGGSDFWESGVVHPDRILEDLHTIFSGSGDSTWYYKRLE